MSLNPYLRQTFIACFGEIFIRYSNTTLLLLIERLVQIKFLSAYFLSVLEHDFLLFVDWMVRWFIDIKILVLSTWVLGSIVKIIVLWGMQRSLHAWIHMILAKLRGFLFWYNLLCSDRGVRNKDRILLELSNGPPFILVRLLNHCLRDLFVLWLTQDLLNHLVLELVHFKILIRSYPVGLNHCVLEILPVLIETIFGAFWWKNYRWNIWSLHFWICQREIRLENHSLWLGGL